MNIETISTAKNMLSESKFFMGYSRWDENLGRYEDWNEAVERVMNMHRQKYAHVMTPELEGYIAFAEQAYKEKAVLGSQRALQFGGEQIFKHESRLYNCSAAYVDRPRFFQEAMYLLLCGCGVGFSVQKQHVAKLPPLRAVDRKDSMVYTVPDSIEGWSDAFGVLLSSYFVGGGEFPEYEGKTVHFDVSQIRPRGALISGGFKAPGSKGLVSSLEMCRQLLERETANTGYISQEFSEGVEIGTTQKYNSIAMRPIVAYDFVMHMADAVLSGGIRRAACIALFGKDDDEMMKAKTGDWFIDNAQRGRSNNSVILIRDELTREEWAEIMKSVKDFGEPGFIFADDLDALFNPCVEIGLRGYTEDGRSGFQKCNLTETNGAYCTSREKMMYATKAGAILGTLQAGYTNFSYLDQATADITEREALLGVSITGWMTNPDVLFNEDNARDAARQAVAVNKVVAKLLGIRPAARVTTAKPSGNASVLLGCASGIHGDHAKRYFRNVQMTNQDAVTLLIDQTNPKMVELSAWSKSGTDVVVSFPIVAGEGTIFKHELLGVKQLEYVKKAQEIWINNGRNDEATVAPWLSHNISNTITVDDWAEVEQYIFDNRQSFAGISLLSAAGDRAYVQAPFTEVFTAQQLLDMYGEAAMFASGLVVDGCHAFNHLWEACDTAMGFGVTLDEEDSKDLTRRDWVRRAKKFAKQYFNGDLGKMSFCLKDAHNLHKWESITRNLTPVDFTVELTQQVYTEVDTMGAQGCAGGACEAPEWLVKAADAHAAATLS
jgi:ribonucleoside-diphosphate reductase alpha chain